MSQTVTAEPSRRQTRSQSRSANQGLGSLSPIRTGSPILGMDIPKRKVRVTTESSHRPIRGRMSPDPTDYPWTDNQASIKTPVKRVENQEPGNQETGILPEPTLTRGNQSMKRLLGDHNSQESYDEHQDYDQDVTYGEKDQERLLIQLENEDATQFFDADGNPATSFLHDRMNLDADEQEQAVREEGLRVEHQTRTQKLKEKQAAIDREAELLKSELRRMKEKAKRANEFHREQAAVREDLAQQQQNLQEKRQELERLRREVMKSKNKDEDDKKKPDKGKRPEFPRRPYYDDHDNGNNDNGNDDGSNGGDDPDDHDDDNSSHRSFNSDRRYRSPSPIIR
jgi:hypothetical protein